MIDKKEMTDFINFLSGIRSDLLVLSEEVKRLTDACYKARGEFYVDGDEVLPGKAAMIMKPGERLMYYELIERIQMTFGYGRTKSKKTLSQITRGGELIRHGVQRSRFGYYTLRHDTTKRTETKESGISNPDGGTDCFI